MDSKEELEALGFKFVRRYGSEFYEWAASQYTHQEAVKKIIKNVDYFRVPTDKPVIAFDSSFSLNYYPAQKMLELETQENYLLSIGARISAHVKIRDDEEEFFYDIVRNEQESENTLEKMIKECKQSIIYTVAHKPSPFAASVSYLFYQAPNDYEIWNLSYEKPLIIKKGDTILNANDMLLLKLDDEKPLIYIDDIAQRYGESNGITNNKYAVNYIERFILHEVSRRLGLKLWDEEYYIGLR